MIQTLHDNIHVIENFINKSTASFLEKCFSSEIKESLNPGIFAGPGHRATSDYDFMPGTKSLLLDGNEIYNTGIDILKLINSEICNVISNFYDNKYSLRSTFYSTMTAGSKNHMHMDNYFIDEDKNIKVRPGFENDKSSLLYLNESYSGGELYFPIQDLYLKPKAGTLIFFEGNTKIPHSVTEVKSGYRTNIISFYSQTGHIDYNQDISVQDKHPISEEIIEKIKEINNAVR